MGRKYTLDHNYFEKIDSEDKAYFLGLMYSDGYNKGNRARIKLQCQDRDILEKFNYCLKSDKPLGPGKNKGILNHWVLEMSSRKIAEDLNKLGCVQRKSLILEFPTEEQVPKHLLRHFIRGYFDGDGCFSYIKPKNGTNYTGVVSIMSTLNFCNKLSEITEREIGRKGFIDKNVKGETTTSIFYLGGNLQAKLFLEWVYTDSTIFLNRKYQKYIHSYVNHETKWKSLMKGPWTYEEKLSMESDYTSGEKTLRDLAKIHGRSRKDIAFFLRSKNIEVKRKKNSHPE